MDDLRLQAVAARVVAWHNRHPLARRISAQQVRSVGYVALGVGADGDGDAHVHVHGVAAAVPDALAALDPPAAGPATPGVPTAADDDFAAAFAALAEHHAADAPASANAAVADDAGGSGTAAVTVDAPVQADGDDDVFEIELDVPADPAAPAAAPATAALTASAAVAPLQPPSAAGASPPTADLASEDSDVETLLATDTTEPHAPLTPAPIALPPHLPTLRDRVLVRAQQPAVQGGLLTAHEGYRPTAHPHAQLPAWAQAAAEHGEGDRFMAPLSPRDVARWVAQHGRTLLTPPGDGPVRRVSTAAVAGGPAAGTTYVMTAAIAGGGLTSRVLVGAGNPGAVLGARLWSGPRVATAAALGALLLAAAAVALAGWLQPAGHGVVAVPAHGGEAASAASAASAAGVLAAAASAAAVSQAAAHPPPAAPSATSDAEPAAEAAPAAAELAITTVKPAPAYAQKGTVGLPPRGLGLSEDDKAAARLAVTAARAGRPAAPRESRGAAPPAKGLQGGVASVESAAAMAIAAAAAPPAEVPAGPSFAISTRALRTRAEAEQLQVAITALLRTPGAASRRVELLPEGDDWRVVAWPFIGQAEADRLRALLAGRGMKVEVVRF